MRLARPVDDRLLAALLVVAGGAVLFFRLGQGSLLDFDEATYAEIAREVGVFHDFVHLHFDYAPWLNKAPLYVWLTAGLFKVFGTTEFWARAVSAGAGAGVLGLTYLLGRSWLDRGAAAGAALLLLLSNLFVRAARFGTSDILLTFWIYGGIYAYVRSRRSSRWWYAVGACWGLAFMTKDLASLVGPAAVGIALVLDRDLRALRTPEPYLAVAIAVAVAVPWHVAVYLWQGPGFLQQYIGYMVVARAQQQIEGHTGGLDYYAIWSGIGFYPWTFAAVAGFAHHALADLRSRRASTVLAVFTVGVLALYTLVRSKLYWYIDPLFPAYALFAAGGIGWALRRRGFAVIGIAVLIALIGIWQPPNTVEGPPFWTQLLLTAVLLVGAAAGLAWGRRTGPAVAAGVIAFSAASAITVAPLYSLPEQVAPTLGRAARTTEGAPMIVYAGPVLQPQDDVAHSLIFYSHRRVTTVVGADQLKAAVPCGHSSDTVLDTAVVPTLPAGYTWTEKAGWFRFGLGKIDARC